MNKEKLINRRIKEAEEQYRKEHFNRAAELYESVLKIEPAHEAANLGLFTCTSDQWPSERAITEIDRLVGQFPENPGYWLFRGNRYGQVQKTTEAEESYRRCIALDPENYEAIHHLGALLIAFGNQEEGLGLLKQAIIIKPDYQVGHSTLAQTYYLTARYEDAIREAELVREIISDTPDLQIAYGESLYQTGTYAKAREIFSRIVEDTLLSSPMYAMLCPLLRERDGYNHQGAATGADPDYLAATYYRAFLSLDQDKNKNPISAADLQKVLAENPHHAYALSGIGSLDKLNKQIPEAISWVEKAIALDPSNPVFIRQKAFILVDEDPQASLSLFDALITRDQADTRSLVGKAWALKGAGKIEESSALLNELSNTDPDFLMSLMGSPLGGDPNSSGSGTGLPAARQGQGRRSPQSRR